MRRGGTTASADFRPTPPPLTGDSSAFRQAWVTDTSGGSPWIRRLTFAAQAPDLPMRMNTVLSFWGGLREAWPTHLSAPALYRVSVRNLAALTRMRLTTTLCQLTDTFAGFLPTVSYPSAVALVSYLVNRSHSWYPAYLQTFVLVQGTHTPLVIRHARRTKRFKRTRTSGGFSACEGLWLS